MVCSAGRTPVGGRRRQDSDIGSLDPASCLDAVSFLVRLPQIVYPLVRSFVRSSRVSSLVSCLEETFTRFRSIASSISHSFYGASPFLSLDSTFWDWNPGLVEPLERPLGLVTLVLRMLCIHIPLSFSP